MRHKTVFVTQRSERHQQNALAAAPDSLDIIMLHKPNDDLLKSQLAEAVYLISERRGTIRADLLDAAPLLQLVLRLGSQTHDIDLQVAQERHIAVTYWPIGSVIRVAEHVIMQMLILIKRLRESQRIALAACSGWGERQRTDENTFAYNWSGLEHVRGLWQQTIGIMGFGEIGFELVRRLRGWDCHILYFKRSRLPKRVEHQLNLNYVDDVMLLQNSDIVVNLLPYSKQTDGYFNALRLQLMQPHSLLVSVGSGSVIDEAALADAITQGYLKGAALDTFEYEPLQLDNPLLRLARAGFNVLLTPHIAGGSSMNLQELREQYTNIIHHIEDEPLLYQLV